MIDYTPTITALDREIQDLVAAHPYPTVPANTEIFEPTTLKLPNSEAIAHYENEVQFVDHTISEFARIIEPHGLLLRPDAGSKCGYELRYMASAAPRTNRTERSPLAPLLAARKQDAYRALDGYLTGLQGRLPVLPAADRMYQAVEQLLQYRVSCKKQLAGLDKGERGEDLVLENLNKTKFKYIIRSSVVLPAVTEDSQTAETDAYVITPKGVFVLEVKNKGNKNAKIEISKDGRWRELYNGRVTHVYGEKKRDKTPAEQNIIHKMNTEAFLKQNGFEDVPLYPVVVFANNEVTIENESHDVVLRNSALISYIESIEGLNLLSREEMEDIAALFDREGLEARAFDVSCLSDKEDMIIPYLESLVRVFYDQKQSEKKIGELLTDTVEKIVNQADEASKQAVKQSTKKHIDHGTSTVLNVIRIALTVVFSSEVFHWIDKLRWFRRMLFDAGYLGNGSHWDVFASSISYVTNPLVMAGIWLISVIGSGLLVCLLPRLVVQNIRQKNKQYAINSLANVLLLTVIYFVTLILLGTGVGYGAVIGLAILPYFGWRIWNGKFMIRLKK